MDLLKTALGIELGSTRIKAVLIDERHLPVASGDFEWENQYVNGVWTYCHIIIAGRTDACPPGVSIISGANGVRLWCRIGVNFGL